MRQLLEAHADPNARDKDGPADPARTTAHSIDDDDELGVYCKATGTAQRTHSVIQKNTFCSTECADDDEIGVSCKATGTPIRVSGKKMSTAKENTFYHM